MWCARFYCKNTREMRLLTFCVSSNLRTEPTLWLLYCPLPPPFFPNFSWLNLSFRSIVDLFPLHPSPPLLHIWTGLVVRELRLRKFLSFVLYCAVSMMHIQMGWNPKVSGCHSDSRVIRLCSVQSLSFRPLAYPLAGSYTPTRFPIQLTTHDLHKCCLSLAQMDSFAKLWFSASKNVHRCCWMNAAQSEDELKTHNARRIETENLWNQHEWNKLRWVNTTHIEQKWHRWTYEQLS